jgi:hypothetical protein
MVILAAEDVGLADPQALVVAMAAQQAAHFVGMPEGFLPLAEAALYLATAPKSNSALTAYSKARQDVIETPAESVPLHLRNAPTPLMRRLGYGGTIIIRTMHLTTMWTSHTCHRGCRAIATTSRASLATRRASRSGWSGCGSEGPRQTSKQPCHSGMRRRGARSGVGQRN